MTWAPNASFNDKLLVRESTPILAVEIAGHATVYTTGPVTSASWTYKKILRNVSVDPSTIDPRSGRWAFSSFTFQLVDADGLATAALATDAPTSDIPSLSGRRCKLWMGYAGLPQSSYEVIGLYSITSVEMSEYGVFDFRASDPFEKLNHALFTSFGDRWTAQLTVAAAIGETRIFVTSHDNFTPGTPIVVVEDENRWFIDTLQPSDSNAGYGLFWNGTSFDKYIELASALIIPISTRAELSECWTIQGNPVNLFMRLLLDDFTTVGTVQTNWPIESVRGNFTTGDGFGMDAADFDTTAIQGERDLFVGDVSGRLVVTARASDGYTYLRQFLTGLGFLFVRRSGLIGFRSMRVPIATGSIVSLSADNVLSVKWERKLDQAVSVMILEGDVVLDQAVTIGTFDDAEAVAAIGRREITLRVPWLFSDLNGVAVGTALAGRFLARFGKGHQVVKCRAMPWLLTVEPGDSVFLTHPAIPDTVTGSSISAAVCEVVGAAPVFSGDDKGVEVEAWRYSGRRTGFIAPDPQTDYATDDATTRSTYAYICQDDGLMSDGQSGYEWI